MKHKLGLGVEAWGGTNDWGRDAYYPEALKYPTEETQGGPFLFQCKFVNGANSAGANVEKPISNAIQRECDVNRYSKSERFTDFEGVGLDSARIDPETKQLLEYNIRRKNWEEWYESKSKNKWIINMRRLATSPIRLFWSISDYGLSTGRIMLSFILLTVIFATIYFIWGWVDYYLLGIKDEPGIVKNLFIIPQAQQQMSDVYYCLMIYFRSICISVITMFSFGDISVVNTQPGWRWWFSHFIPIVQMVTGYMLLGALVTRFAVLFTAGGPAGNFVPMDGETKQLLKKLKEDKEKANKR